jgi:site-specific DNA recombinase
MNQSQSNPLVRARAKTSHKIAFYIRVSTEEQAENPEGSPRNQDHRLREKVEELNRQSHFGEVAAIYSDEGISAKNTKRPQLQKMLLAIERKEITFVMVTEISRLSRNVKDFTELCEFMGRHHCGFLSLKDPYDTTNAAGLLVMNIMATLAQFERQQTGERVTASIVARSKRGLYNGGPVPLGYKLIPEKPGYLAVDEEQIQIVRKAFAAFLKDRTLTSAAKRLNAEGLRYKQKMEGGGNKPRLGHFTVDNLYCILKNKAYIGVKTYKTNGETLESPAVWEATIDRDSFELAGELLKKNYRRQKRGIKNRFPYLLSGILYCGECGERLSGKTATGKSGKVQYYEHAWSTKRQSCLVDKCFNCKHRRILAKRLEPAVWMEIEKLFKEQKIVDGLLHEAQQLHDKRNRVSDSKRLIDKIQSLGSQIDALAERIAVLPTSLSPEPFYKQMEKLQTAKAVEEKAISELEKNNGQAFDVPVETSSYQAFLSGLSRLQDDPKGRELRAQIVQMLLQKIEVFPTTFRLHFLMGKHYIERELASAGSPVFLCPNSGKDAEKGHAATPPSLFKSIGSKSIDIGVPYGSRTRVA